MQCRPARPVGDVNSSDLVSRARHHDDCCNNHVMPYGKSSGCFYCWKGSKKNKNAKKRERENHDTSLIYVHVKIVCPTKLFHLNRVFVSVYFFCLQFWCPSL